MQAGDTMEGTKANHSIGVWLTWASRRMPGVLAGRLGQVGMRGDVGDLGLAGRDVWCRGNSEHGLHGRRADRGVYRLGVLVCRCIAVLHRDPGLHVGIKTRPGAVAGWGSSSGARGCAGVMQTRAGRCWVRVKEGKGPGAEARCSVEGKSRADKGAGDVIACWG